VNDANWLCESAPDRASESDNGARPQTAIERRREIVIKVTAFLTRRPDLSQEQFSAYWRDKHAPLVLSLGPFTSLVRRYVQQRPVEGVPNQLPLVPYDGIAELWFDNLGDVLKLLGHELFLSVVAKDEEHFLDRSRTAIFISQETAIF
jgi:uncharacterized protein (TIGR02118 family)